MLEQYISRQLDIDQNILNLFIKDQYTEQEIMKTMNCSYSKINRVIKKLKVYLRKFNYE